MINSRATIRTVLEYKMGLIKKSDISNAEGKKTQ